MRLTYTTGHPRKKNEKCATCVGTLAEREQERERERERARERESERASARASLVSPGWQCISETIGTSPSHLPCLCLKLGKLLGRPAAMRVTDWVVPFRNFEFLQEGVRTSHLSLQDHLPIHRGQFLRLSDGTSRGSRVARREWAKNPNKNTGAARVHGAVRCVREPAPFPPKLGIERRARNQNGY